MADDVFGFNKDDVNRIRKSVRTNENTNPPHIGGASSPRLQMVPVLVQITSTTGFYGRYRGKMWILNINVSGGDFVTSDLGTAPTDENCIFLNLAEIGTNYMDIDLSDATQCNIWGVVCGQDTTSGFPIVIGLSIPIRSISCPED